MKVQKWFEKHNTFDQTEPNLKSIYTGVVALSDSGINCDETEKVGEEIQKSLDGKTLQTATIKKKTLSKLWRTSKVVLSLKKKQLSSIQW